MVRRRLARRICIKSSSHALVQMQTFPNEWHARHARRILQERGPSAEAVAQLKALAASTMGQPAIQLRILLTQYAVGGLSDRDEIERGLLTRIRCYEPGQSSWPPNTELRSRPYSLGSVSLRGPTLRRWSGSTWPRRHSVCRQKRDGISSKGLVAHAEDAGDHNLPLMYWYAAEPLAAVDASRAARLAAGSRIPRIQEFMARRIGAIGNTRIVGTPGQ